MYEKNTPPFQVGLELLPTEDSFVFILLFFCRYPTFEVPEPISILGILFKGLHRGEGSGKGLSDPMSVGQLGEVNTIFVSEEKCLGHMVLI